MYVPSETIFYTILKSEKLNDYAAKRKIYITSPNIFHYFLQTIMIGIERNQISKKTQQVLYNLKGIQRDAENFSEVLSLTDKHLSNARKQMGQAKESFSDLKHKIANTAQIKQETEDGTNSDIAKEQVESEEKIYIENLK
jgi:DNA anti-recombination protein RmuC